MDVVTVEFENIPAAALELIERTVPVITPNVFGALMSRPGGPKLGALVKGITANPGAMIDSAELSRFNANEEGVRPVLDHLRRRTRTLAVDVRARGRSPRIASARIAGSSRAVSNSNCFGSRKKLV